MSGYFVLKRSGAEYMFNLKAGNHETILTSQRYATKSAAEGGIASVQENGPNDARYDRLIAKDASPYFNLKAANGAIIGSSEMYSSTAASENGISSVKTNASTTTTRDET
ncbi:MAG TPA: YegP family protein [Paraburkholderia sp.]|jgi:hypothetical protein